MRRKVIALLLSVCMLALPLGAAVRRKAEIRKIHLL